MSIVYLHAGLSKAGSTTIQRFMWSNRKILSSKGVCVPDSGYRYQGVHRSRNAHFLAARYLKNTKERQYDRECSQFLDSLAELSHNFDYIFLSDELLWWTGHHYKNFWKDLKNDFDSRGLELKIVLYLRRQDLWLQSSWAQKIKRGTLKKGEDAVGCCLTAHEYIGLKQKQKYPLDYYAYISKLAALFGKDALCIRIFEKEQFRGAEQTLLSDLLDLFGLSPSEEFKVKSEIWNSKMGWNYLEFKRILNHLPEFHDDKNTLIRYIKEIQRKNPFGYDNKSYSCFTPQEQQTITDLYAESNSRLAREYLGREDGILFHELDALPAFEPDSENLLRDTILIYGHMINRLCDQVEQQKAMIDRIQKDLSSPGQSDETYPQNTFLRRIKKAGRHLIYGRTENEICRNC